MFDKEVVPLTKVVLFAKMVPQWSCFPKKGQGAILVPLWSRFSNKKVKNGLTILKVEPLENSATFLKVVLLRNRLMKVVPLRNRNSTSVEPK